MLNIAISDCEFEDNASGDLGVISIKYANEVSNRNAEGGLFISKDEIAHTKTMLFVAPMWLNVTKTRFSRQSQYTYLIELSNYANVNLKEVSLSENGDSQTSLSITRNYMRNSYARITPVFGLGSACQGGILFSSIVNADISTTALSKNHCESSGIGLIFKSTSGRVSITDISVTENVSGGASGTAIECSDSTGLILTNMTAVGNSNSRSGVIFLHTNASIAILQSTFERNSGFAGAVIHSAGGQLIAISKCAFARNTAATGKGGVLFLDPLLSATTELSIFSSNFSENRAQFGGVVYLSYLSTGAPVSLCIQNSSFSRNTADVAGASFHGNYGGFTNFSIIQYCDFEGENSPAGSLVLMHQSGSLSITMSVFRNNTGSTAAVITMQTCNSAITVLTDLLFVGNGNAPIIVKQNHRISTTFFTINCTFVDNESGAMELDNGQWWDTGSVFIRSGNTAVMLVGMAEGRSNSSVFDSNQSPVYAGGVFVSSNARFICENCAFVGNSAGNSGGAIFSERNAFISVTNCKFEGNSAKESGAAVFLLSSQLSYIRNCEFRGNIALETAVVSMLTSEIVIDSCVICGNIGGKTAGLSLTFSVITVRNSTFCSQSSQESAFISLISASSADISNSSFTTGKGVFSGGIYVKSSNLTLTNSTFADISGEYAGGISSESLSIVVCTGVRMEKMVSSHPGSLISASKSSLFITQSHFSNYSVGGVHTQEMSQVSINQSVFTYGNGLLGSAVTCLECINVTLSNTEFSNQTTKFGVVYLFFTENDIAGGQIFIDNCQFRGNIGEKGAAVYATNFRLTVASSIFENNTAEASDGEGGALFLDCSVPVFCNSSIYSSSFARNSAGKAGGAISWKLVQPTLYDVWMRNNTARYGPNVASFAVGLELTTSIQSVGKSIDSIRPGSVLIDIPPGQSAGVSLKATLVDHYKQVLTTDYFSTAELTSANLASASVSGIIKVSAERGAFTFSNFLIYADPGARVSLLLNASLPMRDTSEGQVLQTLSYLLEFAMRTCVPGESIAPKSCIVCEYGTFGVDPTEPCQNCPQNAECLGNYTVVPDYGYWRPGNLSKIVMKCPRQNACLGGFPGKTGPVSLNGYCSEGYEGNLCQSCASKFSRTGKNKCDLCPSLPVNAVRLIFTAFAMTVLISVLVYTTMRSSTRPAAVHSIYIKILVNYLQLISLVAEFKLNWPEAVIRIFEVQEQVGISEQILSLDCFLSENQKAADVFYYKIIYMAAMPMLMGFCVVAYWVSIAVYRKKKKKLRKQLPATLVIVFFFMHPTFAKTLLSIFSCTQINPNEYWLTYDMAIRCWNQQHYKYLFQVGIPGLMVWVFGIPMICLCVLVRCRKRLEELWIKLSFGFLINGYRRRRFYWEFVVIYRKITIICCSVFLISYISIQALVVQLVMVIHFFIHWEVSPYLHEMSNKLELRAIIVADITIYCGLFFLTDNLTDMGSWFFFGIIVAINILFLAVWANAMVNYFLVILARKIPLIGRIYSPEIVNRDEYIERFILMFGKGRKATKYENFPYKRLSEIFVFMGKRKHPTLDVPEMSIASNLYFPRIPFVKNRSFDEVTEAGTRRVTTSHERSPPILSPFYFPPERYQF